MGAHFQRMHEDFKALPLSNLVAAADEATRIIGDTLVDPLAP